MKPLSMDDKIRNGLFSATVNAGWAAAVEAARKAGVPPEAASGDSRDGKKGAPPKLTVEEKKGL